MICSTINDDKTIAGGGEGASIARSLRCQYPFNLMFPIRDACVTNRKHKVERILATQTTGDARALATACNRLVVVDGAADHNLTPFQLLPNAHPCPDQRGEGAAHP